MHHYVWNPAYQLAMLLSLAGDDIPGWQVSNVDAGFALEMDCQDLLLTRKGRKLKVDSVDDEMD